MPKVFMPPNCYGVKAFDGTVYRTRPGGAVEINNPKHLKEILHDPQIAGDIVQERGMPLVEGKTCTCGFEAFKWQKECPRCGTEMKGTK